MGCAAESVGDCLQTTIKSYVAFDGVGLHSGLPARVADIAGAPRPWHLFSSDGDLGPDAAPIPALWNLVEQAPLCTRLINHDGVTVSTVEHVMAAFAGCGVHNAVVIVDGPELPILDGSSANFVRGILNCGLRTYDAPVRAIRVQDRLK